MEITHAKTSLRCDKCSHLKILNELTMFKNDQKPWVLVCPYSSLVIGLVPTTKGVEEQRIPEIAAPFHCRLRQKERIKGKESSFELRLAFNCQ